MVREKSNRLRSRPWGSVAALAMACVATLVGVARGLDPEVVLLRATIAAIVIGAGSSIAATLFRWLETNRVQGASSTTQPAGKSQ